MTDAQIIAEAESLVRITSGPTVAQKAAWLNRIQRSYARKDDWPELKTLAATLSTTANQAYATLPAGFERFIGNTVLYNPTAITGGYQGGTPLPILASGDKRLEGIISAWRPLGSGTPLAVSLAGAYAAYKLYLYPLPDAGSITIVYDYYRAPTTLTGLGVSPDVQALCDTFTMALCVQFCLYDENEEQLAFYRNEEKREYRNALRNLLIT